MTTHTQDQADADLRALLAQADPEAPTAGTVPPHLLDRVQAAVAADPVGPPMPSAAWPHPLAGASDDEDAAHPAPTRAPLPRPRWQPWLLAAAGITSLALAAGTVLPGLAGGDDAGSADMAASGESAPGAGVDASGGGAVGAPEANRDAAAEDSAATAPDAATSQDEAENTLVRSASMLVGVEDVPAARDAFVARVLSRGGRVTSETVVTEDGSGGIDQYAADSMAAARDLGMGYPYPWYPTGPGIWLGVQVPADEYDATVEAARALGTVVQMQQSSYDVGAQKTDVETRIAALEASLDRLTALMGQAEDIADVIALEQAIAQRQAELDALRAQQRELANQTAMSQISLTLMTPEDAQQAVDPQPRQSWWESFLEGLSQFWTWLGRALLIVSPLLLAWAVIAWWRHRARRRPNRRPGTTQGPGEEAPPPAEG
jgi:hypothetical protein